MDFLTFASYYDDHTVITKNGELLQTLRFVNITSKNVSQLREVFRKSIIKNFNTTNISFWIHTLRRKKDISDKEIYKIENDFSRNFLIQWSEDHKMHERSVNEVYITFLIRGSDASVQNLDSIFRRVFFSVLKRNNILYLDNFYKSLEDSVCALIEDLREFLPERLNCNDFDRISSLYYNILTGKREKIQIKPFDLSKAFDFKYEVFFNYLFFQDLDQYLSVLSFKEMPDKNLDGIEEMMSVVDDITITENLYFTDRQQLKKLMSDQKKYLEVIDDKDLHSIKNIDFIFASNEGKFNLACERQVTILVYAKSYGELENKISLLTSKIEKLGLPCVREDINTENIFWSQIPGNFRFMRRKFKSQTLTIGNFILIQKYPTGSLNATWGKWLNIFESKYKTPFFINLYNNSLGSTAIIGPENSGKSTLMNFLIVSALKFQPKITYISDFEYNISQKIDMQQEIANKQQVPWNIFLPQNEFYYKKLFKILTFDSDKEDTIKEIVDQMLKIENPTFDSLSTLVIDDQKIRNILTSYAQDSEYRQMLYSNVSIDVAAKAFVIGDFDKDTNLEQLHRSYPDDKFFVEKKIKEICAIKDVILFSILWSFFEKKEDKSILALDGLCGMIISETLKQYLMKNIKKDIVCIATMETEKLHLLYKPMQYDNFMTIFGQKFFLPYEVISDKIFDFLPLSKEQLHSLKSYGFKNRNILLKSSEEEDIELDIDIGELSEYI